MNRNRRNQHHVKFGFASGGFNRATFTRKPRMVFEKVKPLYERIVPKNNNVVSISNEGKQSLSLDIKKMIAAEKKDQLHSYISHFLLLIISILVTAYIML